MKEHGSTIRLATEPVLKTGERDERLGGSTPSASVCTERASINGTDPFEGRHQYTRRIDAEDKQVWSQPSNLGINLLPLGASDTKNTRPRSNPGPLCILEKTETERKQHMPNATPPTKPIPSSSVCQKLAFEQLIDEAFSLRHKTEQLTDGIVLGLTMAARELERKKDVGPAGTRKAG